VRRTRLLRAQRYDEDVFLSILPDLNPTDFRPANNSKESRSFFLAKDKLILVFSDSGEQTVLTNEKGEWMNINTFRNLWTDDQGQDIAEYAVMLAVILVLVVGTIRLIGSSSNNVFSSVASSIGQ
jgi:Flp pilus assembly pilin Flp